MDATDLIGNFQVKLTVLLAIAGCTVILQLTCFAVVLGAVDLSGFLIITVGLGFSNFGILSIFFGDD